LLARIYARLPNQRSADGLAAWVGRSGLVRDPSGDESLLAHICLLAMMGQIALIKIFLVTAAIGQLGRNFP
jgi:hypothetical protein